MKSCWLFSCRQLSPWEGLEHPVETSFFAIKLSTREQSATFHELRHSILWGRNENGTIHTTKLNNSTSQSHCTPSWTTWLSLSTSSMELDHLTLRLSTVDCELESSEHCSMERSALKLQQTLMAASPLLFLASLMLLFTTSTINIKCLGRHSSTNVEFFERTSTKHVSPFSVSASVP